MPDELKDWKLKLRYGKLTTPFKHFTVLADGLASDEMREGFDCPPGRAWMAMKLWAESEEEAFDMMQWVGADVGFRIDGKMELFDTDPEQSPREEPYGYDIRFTPYDE